MRHAKAQVDALLGDIHQKSQEAASSGLLDREKYVIPPHLHDLQEADLPETQRGLVMTEIAQFRERAAKRVQHWQALVQAACEQCGRARVPAVAPVSTLREWLAAARSTDAPRVLLSPRGTQSLTQWAVQSRTRIEGSGIVLLIGPEGGLSPDEEALAESAGFLPLTLGRRILRTESAALVAVSALHAVLGEF